MVKGNALNGLLKDYCRFVGFGCASENHAECRYHRGSCGIKLRHGFWAYSLRYRAGPNGPYVAPFESPGSGSDGLQGSGFCALENHAESFYNLCNGIVESRSDLQLKPLWRTSSSNYMGSVRSSCNLLSMPLGIKQKANVDGYQENFND